MAVFGILVFFVLVIFVQKFNSVFASFMGAVLVTLCVTPLFSSLDEPYLRIVQLVVAIILGAIGAVGQHYIQKWIDKRNEEIVWIPSIPA